MCAKFHSFQAVFRETGGIIKSSVFDHMFTGGHWGSPSDRRTPSALPMATKMGMRYHWKKFGIIPTRFQSFSPFLIFSSISQRIPKRAKLLKSYWNDPKFIYMIDHTHISGRLCAIMMI